MAALSDTNVSGMVRMLHAFLPLLARPAAPVVVNLSSGLSKTAGLADPGGPVGFYPGIAYPASKTAVNTVTVQYAKAFPGITINAVDPGYTATSWSTTPAATPRRTGKTPAPSAASIRRTSSGSPR